MRLDGSPDRGICPGDRARLGGLIDQCQKPRRARVDGFVEPVTKARQVGPARFRQVSSVVPSPSSPALRRTINLHRLFARPAMHVAQHIEPGRHGRLQADAAGRAIRAAAIEGACGP
jgi:hypothetical protein